MPQHDMNIASAAGATARADINNALLALVGNNDGTTEPAVKFANMWWVDTTSGYMKQRNAANTAWLNKYKLAEGELALLAGSATQDFSAKKLTLAESVLYAKASVAAHATTMNPWSLGNYVDVTGTAVTFTNMAAAPQAGAEVELYMNAAHVFTDGAVFEVDGNANYTAAVGDRVLLRAKTTTVFTVHPRKADGTAIVAPSSAVFTSEFTSAELTFSGGASGSAAAAHGFGAIPKKWEARIRCKTAEFNYSVGDEVLMGGSTANGDPPLVCTADATNITVSWQDVRSIANKSTGAGTGPLTNASWRWVLKAWN